TNRNCREKKHLDDLQKQYKEHSVHTKIINDRLIFTTNGTIYEDKVKIPTAEEILLCDNIELKSLDDEVTETMEPITDDGNNIKSFFLYNDVRKFCKKVIHNPGYTRAKNKIVAYRFKDQAGKLHEGHGDDCEIDARRQITDNAIENMAVVITRFASERKLRPKRFGYIKDITLNLAHKLS
ncbi:hypothetical protein KUTeg_001200, partial [Tegillarca granosa]